MAKHFNPDKYSPADDSSHGTPTNSKVLVLEYEDGICQCGCGALKPNPKTKFVIGHDAKLKGKLIRAHLAGVDVKVNKAKPVPAMAVASTLGWEGYLVNAEARRRPTATPKVGDSVPVKKGRGTYTGQIVSIAKGIATVEFVQGNGKTGSTTIKVA